MFEGFFKDDSPDDAGDSVTIYFSNGKILYEGNMKSGIKHGMGTTYYKTGILEFKGNWINNMPNGEDCVVYGKDGNIVFEGKLENGISKDDVCGIIKYQYGGL